MGGRTKRGKGKALTAFTQRVLGAAEDLNQRVTDIDFRPAVPWVYNPLDYAWDRHAEYLTRYARPSCQVLFLGMNPGPWGMAQTGVPFGEIDSVRDFLQIDGPVRQPEPMHPKRPIEGLACPRSEVSGRRLWGLFRERFGSAEAFFDQHFVANYCPLVFMEESARNVTPDKLPAQHRGELEAVCDGHLAALIELLEPQWLVGVGAFAEKCLQRVLNRSKGNKAQLGRILHPSPASPAANRDWAGTATQQLEAIGVW